MCSVLKIREGKVSRVRRETIYMCVGQTSLLVGRLPLQLVFVSVAA